jgi:TolA-binding protein
LRKIFYAASFIFALAFSAAAQQPQQQQTAASNPNVAQSTSRADKAVGVTKLPEAVSARYRQLQQQIEEVQRNAQQQVQLLQLMQQNALLEGMLELGLTKKQVESMVLSTEGTDLVLKPKPQTAALPTENPPAKTTPKLD